MLSKLDVAHADTQSNRGAVCSKGSTSHRRRALRVLFVHLDADVVESCSQELDKAQFTVKSDFVLSLAQSADQLRVQPADVMTNAIPPCGACDPRFPTSIPYDRPAHELCETARGRVTW